MSQFNQIKFAVTGITTYVVLALYYRKLLRTPVAPLEDVDPKTLLVDRCGIACLTLRDPNVDPPERTRKPARRAAARHEAVSPVSRR